MDCNTMETFFKDFLEVFTSEIKLTGSDRL